MKKMILLCGIFLCTYMLHAQVTIGSRNIANSGSLLDLKENDVPDGGANSNRGLLLPRVTMSTLEPAIGSLAPSIGGTGSWDEAEHIGLMVYNVTNTLDACAGGAYEGLYTWDGRKWVPGYTKKLVPPATEITTDDFQGSNSYLVKTNQTVEIPVKRAFDIWTAYVGSDATTGKVLSLTDVNNLSGALTTEIVWQETGVLTSVSVSGAGSAAMLTVHAGGSQGNALVRVLIGGKVLWQWHIWVNNTNPLDNAHAYIVNGKTDWYMDRFLGAGAVSGAGLYYQWGRHVPITKEGTVGLLAATAAEKDNLTGAIQSEKFITYYTTDTHDWYSSTLSQWDARWGDLNGGNTKKSPFDPCPYGWRLPSASDNKSPWECLDVTTGGGSSGGWDFGDTGRELGYFAATGYRANGDGSLGDVGTAGYVWTASPNGNMAGALYYDGTSINTWAAFNRANGMNVRCLKEK